MAGRQTERQTEKGQKGEVNINTSFFPLQVDLGIFENGPPLELHCVRDPAQPVERVALDVKEESEEDVIPPPE